MKKYIKPSINVINLKSSENIATTTFKSVRSKFIEEVLMGSNGKQYTVSQYSLNTSALETVVE